MEEEILGVIENAQSGTSRVFNVYLTSERIVGINMGSPGIGYAVGGVVGYALAKRSAEKKTEKYRGISLESQLKSDKKNFAIPYGNVQKCVLKREGLTQGQVKVKATNQKVKLVLPKKKGYAALAENVLTQKIPDRLVVK